MIPYFFLYLFKVAVCSGIFFGYYWFVLRNLRMHQFNRFYLLATALLSLIVPALHFQLFEIAKENATNIPLLQLINDGGREEAIVVQNTSHFSWQIFSYVVYGSVATVMLLTFCWKIVLLYRLKAKENKTARNGYWLIDSDDPEAPFSFMNLLFWPKHLTFESLESNTMLQHELTHIKQRHSLDKILVHCIVAACWVNPFFWLMRKELSLQHEYLADQYAIKDRDTETFARMLLCATYGITGNTIAHAFYQSSIKKRLAMLTRNSNKTRLRRFLAIPVLAVSLGIFSFSTSDNVVRAKKTIHVVLDPAHGGKDLGGGNASGDFEKDLTLRIANELQVLGGAYNIQCTLTRDGDVTKPLQDRIDFSNNSNADLFVSVHINKDAAADVHGNDYELGINAKSTDYKQAQLLASAVGHRLKTQQIAAKVVDRHNVMVIRNNKHTALLLACGNIDDSKNMAMLKDSKQLESFCRNVLSGVVDFENEVNK